MKGNSIEESSRHERSQQREACRVNVVRGDMPAVGSAFGRVTKSFAHPHRCRKSRRPQLRDDRRGLFVCVFLDHTAMRSDDDKVGLALSVLSHFKEPDTRGLAGGVKYASFDGRLFQFRAIAEPFTTGQACANDIRAAGTVWVRLIDRKNSNEPRIVPTPDSNLLAHGATDTARLAGSAEQRSASFFSGSCSGRRSFKFRASYAD